jgi:hypothetical protein
MALPPPLSAEERAANLAKAAKVRAARADVRRQLKSGELSLAAALSRSADDEAIAKMKAIALLESLPAVGKIKAQRVMEQVGIAETRRVQGLGAKQRAELLRLLGR